MTPTGRPPEHEQLRLLLGAHVLGGLDATDRAAVEEHLAGCADCREDLVRLAPLPGLLRRAPSGATGSLLPGTAGGEVTLEPLLAAVRQDRARRRRRSRARLTGVAAAAVLAVAVVTALPRDAGAPTDQTTPSATSQLLPVDGAATTGRAELEAKAWGTALTVTLTDLPAPGPYVLLATAQGQTPQQAAAWAATPAGSATVTGATWLRPEQISAVQVLDADGRVLATTTTDWTPTS